MNQKSLEWENLLRHICRIDKKINNFEAMKDAIALIGKKKKDFVCRQTADELLLIPLQDNVADFNQYLTLNEVGAFIWEMLEEDDNEASLVEKICAEFEANEVEVLDDLRAFLDKLSNYLGIQ